MRRVDTDASGGRTIRAVTRMLLLGLAMAVVAGGCGGDDEDAPAAPAPATSSTRAEPAPAPEESRPSAPEDADGRASYSRTPRSLAECLRSARGVSEALVKGRDSEDATFFRELVGGRVDVLGVTLRGSPAEVGVFLFEAPEDAREAAPSAGGGGVVAATRGSAIVAGPKDADTAGIETCLKASGYA